MSLGRLTRRLNQEENSNLILILNLRNRPIGRVPVVLQGVESESESESEDCRQRKGKRNKRRRGNSNRSKKKRTFFLVVLNLGCSFIRTTIASANYRSNIVTPRNKPYSICIHQRSTKAGDHNSSKGRRTLEDNLSALHNYNTMGLSLALKDSQFVLHLSLNPLESTPSHWSFEYRAMEATHILLGRSWQFDRKVTHDGVTNKFSFINKGNKVTLKPLTPMEVIKDQLIMKEKETKRKTN
ncbi:hypothetical protein CR513_15237, partial [Mucuna pruriens]